MLPHGVRLATRGQTRGEREVGGLLLAHAGFRPVRGLELLRIHVSVDVAQLLRVADDGIPMIDSVTSDSSA